MKDFFKQADWFILASIVPLLGAGLVTMRPFAGTEGSYFFNRQLVWIGIGLLLFFIFSAMDWRFLKNSGFLFALFLIAVLVLTSLLLFSRTIKGAASWFDFILFSVEPSEPAKLLLILILAKYFSRRHIAIANFKHIFISAVYAGFLAVLVFLQPDFGSALVFGAIWVGMIMVSGINKKHLLAVLLIMAILFSVSWFLLLKPYQKSRILSFLNPMEDPQGAGYNALQSMIAAGSGQIWGKGLGYGTQSRLKFLPEFRTDFIFSAFAEEWGFVGVMLIFFCFGFVIFRILKIAIRGFTNFERLFAAGLTVFLMTHFVLHVGMNLGLLPITGLTMPFLSYGGSSLITIFAGLGILNGIRNRSVAADD